MIRDLVLETANAPGTGTINLLGAATDRVSFVSVFTTGSLCYYVIDDTVQSEWGVGTFTTGSPNTLARTTVLGNTAGTTARLNFTGAVKVYNDLPSARMVYVDNGNDVVVPGGRIGSLVAGVPIGSGMPFFGSTAPAGYLLCGGQAVSRTTYALLFSVIGTTYGSGDGVSTFVVPDLRGRVPVGLDNMNGSNASRISSVLASTTLGAVGGDQNLQQHNHSLTINDTVHSHGVSDPSHTHAVGDPGHVHAFQTQVTGGGGGTGVPDSNAGGAAPDGTTRAASTGISLFNAGTGISINNAFSGVTTGSIGLNGSGGAQNVQPSLVVNYIIYAGV